MAPPRVVLALLLGGALAMLTACGGGSSDGASDRAVTPPAPSIVTGTAQPDTPVTGPPPVQRLEPAAKAGEVRFADGPFSDAVRITDLRLRRGERPQVTGRLANRFEINPVLSLVVRADFYDAGGRYLISGEQAFAGAGREELEPITKPLRLDIRAGRLAPRAVAAVVSVPDFVPE